MDSEFVNSTSIDLIDPTSLSHNLPINKLNFGRVYTSIRNDSSLKPDEKLNFFRICKKYLKKACDDLKKRVFEINNDWYTDRSSFNPKNTLSKEYHQKHQNLNHVMDEFAGFLTHEKRADINKEWKEVLTFNMPSEISDETKIDIFWSKIKGIEDNEGKAELPNLADFAMLCLLIPNSNASAERLWSKLNFEKTKLRNKLSFESLRSLLLAAALIRDEGGCLNFYPTVAMMEQVLRPGNHSEHDSSAEDANTEEGCLQEYNLINSEQEEENAFDDSELIRQCREEELRYAEWRFKNDKKPKPYTAKPKNEKKRSLADDQGPVNDPAFPVTAAAAATLPVTEASRSVPAMSSISSPTSVTEIRTSVTTSFSDAVPSSETAPFRDMHASISNDLMTSGKLFIK